MNTIITPHTNIGRTLRSMAAGFMMGGLVLFSTSCESPQQRLLNRKDRLETRIKKLENKIERQEIELKQTLESNDKKTQIYATDYIKNGQIPNYPVINRNEIRFRNMNNDTVTVSVNQNTKPFYEAIKKNIVIYDRSADIGIEDTKSFYNDVVNNIKDPLLEAYFNQQWDKYTTKYETVKYVKKAHIIDPDETGSINIKTNEDSITPSEYTEFMYNWAKATGSIKNIEHNRYYRDKNVPNLCRPSTIENMKYYINNYKHSLRNTKKKLDKVNAKLAEGTYIHNN